MKIHEYQAKEILRGYGVPVPRGRMTTQAAEVYDLAKEMGGTVVVKAQIHAGGRGKAGGVKLARSPREAQDIATRLLGSRLFTHQTGPEGKQVQKLLIEEGLNIKKEYYLGIVVDRSRRQPVFMASAEGGVEIEEVAARNPAAILKEHIDPQIGLSPFQARKLAFGLGLPPALVGQAVKVFAALYAAFVATDASMVEINPFLETAEGNLIALDAKVNFDDNALYRHPEFKLLRDYSEEDPLEIEASRFGLNYIKLDGNIGCMVNGAGLAMATMDIIKLAGGNPANFLDVGGGASEESVTSAFRIILSDPHVQAILVNIFGGIVRCDVIARGIINAAKAVGVKVPIVVRLEGTNVDEGRRLLQESGLNIALADGMKDAAEKVVAKARA
ncbi:MAG TPA: ADP-forming succinate--CoA ligase subunit beta [Acidobacteriota bacterium]|jgi:succinyl-CoA synthetase beta subunit|nr:ADP-forming succinate--CoA ligase subunit beta [Acidobacteriota bacterium]HNR39541.1 ADP-forming succinate--CoA ligase subunit beta [Acidobacteriota bacterium]HNU01614.1 ADP-forming succinate--CoA ligase subunit beta [Acidobacteriota bacterium]HPB28648.1 ADP-forming succinate--CoA ligase subunit beta [Acidobacteriota bacterium]HQO24373.1 ADP-forming succinate--CoA ligase subunit beta [Acidobacteriota bacterium]